MNEKDLKNSLKEIEIPKELDQVVKKAIKKGNPNKKPRNSYKKWFLVACSLLFVVLAGAGFKYSSILYKTDEVKGLTLPTIDSKLKLMSLLKDSIEEDKELTKEENASGKIEGTNNQVDGVDEIDTTKTDGKYIFTSYYDNVRNADGINIFNGEDPKKPSFLSKIEIDGYVAGMFTYNSRLIVVTSKERDTIINVYNYEYINDIKKEREIVVSGGNNTARLIGNELVLLQQKYVYSNDKVEESIPFIKEDGVEKKENLENIKYCPGVPADSFLTLVKINLKNKSEIKSESILAKSANVFVSKNNVYLINYDYEKDNSDIYKFSIKDDGKLVAKATFKGKTLNQFSLDEYNENLRVATTIAWGMESSVSEVIVFDKDLKEIGKLSGLGQRGEVIHSVRFMGDMGYVVTFKNTDPLYIIDLKNPTAPKIDGEIKVPGVSKYLHQFDEKSIIGFGEDRDEKNLEGLKLSLFSTENGGKELFNEKISSTFSDAIYNHKAFFFDKENSLIGFNIGRVTETKTLVEMVVYKVSKESGFKRVITAEVPEVFSAARIYGSKDAIYFILGNKVVTYDSKTFEKLGES